MSYAQSLQDSDRARDGGFRLAEGLGRGREIRRLKEWGDQASNKKRIPDGSA
jgi:hypothetical protein